MIKLTDTNFTVLISACTGNIFDETDTLCMQEYLRNWYDAVEICTGVYTHLNGRTNKEDSFIVGCNSSADLERLYELKEVFEQESMLVINNISPVAYLRYAPTRAEVIGTGMQAITWEESQHQQAYTEVNGQYLIVA